MQLRPAHPATLKAWTDRRHLSVQAFRQDASTPSRSNPVTKPEATAPAAGQPLWRKPSFPFVVAIALVTLPFDLAYHHTRPSSSTTYRPPASTSRGSSSGAPPRHAKPGSARKNTPAARAAPAREDVNAREAAAAAAAAVGLAGSQHSQQQQEQQQRQAAGSSPSRHSPAQVSSATTPPAALWPAAAAAAASGAAPGPVDSWEMSEADAGFSEEEAEQQAKAMVIELLTHPKDTEEALMQAAAADPSTNSSGGRPLSVSPEYIDALVEAVKEPSIGMPHHQQPGPTNESSASTTFTSNSMSGADTANAFPSSSGIQPSGSDGSSQQQGAGSQRRRQQANPSLWSWLDGSPHSSQEEF